MTQVEAAADASAGGATADRGRLVQLIVAAVLMGATGVMLVATGVWAVTFKGVMSRELRRALNSHTLTSAGVLVLAAGVPRMFASLERTGHVDNSVMVLGYVVMRVPLVFQWLRG